MGGDVTTLGSYSPDGNRELHPSAVSRPPGPPAPMDNR